MKSSNIFRTISTIIVVCSIYPIVITGSIITSVGHTNWDKLMGLAMLWGAGHILVYSVLMPMYFKWCEFSEEKMKEFLKYDP